jgi:hypothetical protein
MTVVDAAWHAVDAKDATKAGRRYLDCEMAATRLSRAGLIWLPASGKALTQVAQMRVGGFRTAVAEAHANGDAGADICRFCRGEPNRDARETYAHVVVFCTAWVELRNATGLAVLQREPRVVAANHLPQLLPHSIARDGSDASPHAADTQQQNDAAQACTNDSCDSHDTQKDYGTNARDNSLRGHATLDCVLGKLGLFHQKRSHGERLRSFVMCRGRRGILVV